MTEQKTRAAEFGPVEILLVEDNPADVRLTREALSSDRLWNHLSVAKDGVEAMAYLRREGTFAEAARPDLILLDLNLPKKDGREVLVFCLSWKWRERSAVKITERTHEKDAETLHGRREGRHLEAAPVGTGADLVAV